MNLEPALEIIHEDYAARRGAARTVVRPQADQEGGTRDGLGAGLGGIIHWLCGARLVRLFRLALLDHVLQKLSA